jgi:D-3-phosphoglycerate dehydrogenase
VTTLHMPLTEDTKYLVNAERIALMNPGALIINCARGGLADEAAIDAALASGQLGGVALDVYEVEPPVADNPLFRHPKTVFTPHLGASTFEAQENVGIEVAHQLRDFLTTGEIRNAVNMPNLDAKTLAEVGGYLDLAEALGKLLAKIGPSQADAIRITYSGAVAELDTELITRSAITGYLASARNEAQVNLINAPAVAKSLGLRVTESKAAVETNYTELIEATIVKGDDQVSVAGTFLGSQPRIVHIAGHNVETAPSGLFMFVENDDRPGIVGLVGTLLGQAGVNIANMNLSRSEDRTRAVTVIEVDSLPSADLVKQLKAAPGILRVLTIDL